MMKFISVIVLSTLAMVSTGCDSHNKIETVLVDLDAVAIGLGRDEIIQQKIVLAEQRLQEQFKTLVAELQTKVNTEQATLDSKSSDEDKKRVEQFAQQAQQTLRNEQQLAQQRLQQTKVDLISDLRAEIKAAAEPIARELGAKMVKLVSPEVLWIDDSIDISDEVIKKLQEKKAEL